VLGTNPIVRCAPTVAIGSSPMRSPDSRNKVAKALVAGARSCRAEVTKVDDGPQLHPAVSSYLE
jgi:hypothetical protein